MGNWNFEHTYTSLPRAFYTHCKPETAPHPDMLLFNLALAEDLGLDGRALSDEWNTFAGNVAPNGALPYAQAYGGYQFGYFSVLGDGRAHVLGEHIIPDGRRFDVQLKGSGKTAYSRGGDGRAALAPMLREYLISEFMHHAGVPTTRSLAVASTGLTVRRERDYQGAVLTRIASSHIRVGTFNFAQTLELGDLKALADYTIQRHFPEISSEDEPYVLLLRKVAKLQAELIAKWMCLGFVHGVMNTDNMSVSGETIDYGPCAFMDAYDPAVVFSSIDRDGRYSYKNQPIAAGWNLTRFAESLAPLIPLEQAIAEVDTFTYHYEKCWLNGMRAKLGLTDENTQDFDMINELLAEMHKNQLDFTETFRTLNEPTLDAWKQKWQSRLKSKNPNLANKHNPATIPRNHAIEAALQAANLGDLNPTHDLLAALQNPFTPNENYKKPPQCAGANNYVTFCGT